MIINNYWTIVTVIMIMIVIGIFINRMSKGKRNDTNIEIIAILFITLCIALCLCLGLWIGCNKGNVIEHRDSSQLVALNDYTGQKSESNGSMFLLIGGYSSSSSDTYNIRYASKTNGVIKINNMEMNDKVGFVEDNNNELITIWSQKEYTLNSLGKFLFDSPTSSWNKDISGYEFHILKGSITNEVEIDLK